MKTIWILNHHAVTPEQGGGTRHYNFARELVKRGYRVYVFASSHIYNTNTNILSTNETYKVENISGINWVWVRTKQYSGNGLDRIIGMIDFYHFMTHAYKNFEKPDVIIGSSVHPLACLAGIKIARKVKAKSISEIRDLWPQTLVDMGKMTKNSIFAKILYQIEKYIYKKSESIIVTVPGMIDYITVQARIDRSKITYINNGVDVKKYDENKQGNDIHVSKIMEENAGKFKCFYTGAIGGANYIDNIIHSAGLLTDKGIDNISFIIVGDGPEKERLIKLSRDLRLENVKFYPPIKKDSIPLLLDYADIEIFNLKKIDVLKYGISANKMFDYMCSGKPIIFACDTPENYVDESGCGIFVGAEKPQAMAEAIMTMISMKEEERREMGERGRDFVKSHFDIPILVNKLEEVING